MDKHEVYRISDLKKKIVSGTATQAEKDEYVEILRKNKNLSEELYKSYKKNEFVESILETCIILGGIIIAGTLIREKIASNT
jgi:hypothetical protein